MKTKEILQRESIRPESAAEELLFARLRVPAPRELARKVRMLGTPGPGAGEKYFKINLDGTLHLVHLRGTNQRHPMPNAHSPDKEPLSMQIPRTLLGRLKIKARKMGMSVPNYVVTILTHETKDIALSSNDYEAIARATRQAERTGRRCATRFDRPA